MNQNVFTNVYYGTRKFIKINATTILSILAIGGVVGTSVSVGQATNKASKKLKEATETKKEPLNNIEIIATITPIFIPSLLLGGSTIACILGANILNKQSQAALASAYGLADQSFKEYRKKLIELHGEEADQEIQDAIVRQYCSYHQTGVDEPDTKMTFFEPYSKTVLHMYEKELIDAEYHFNRNFTMRGYALLNEWFMFLGLPETSYGETLGWSICDGYTWVDFEHRLVEEPDGTHYYSIDTVFEADNSWKDDWGF